jgi:hypothetical protein
MAVLATRAWLNGTARRNSTALAVLLPMLSTMGQEALRSALSIDSVLAERENPTVNLNPERPHLGPVQLSYSLYAGLEYDDNINGSQVNPQSDTLLRGGAGLGMSWQATERSSLQLGGGLGYVYYVEQTHNSGLEVTPNSALTWQIGFTDGSITLYDQFSYSRQVTQESSTANLTTLPRLENTIGTRVAWEPGRWTLQAGYGHNDFVATDSTFNYLDRSSEYFFARAGWRFAEGTQAGIEASTTLTSYQHSSGNDSESYSVGPYADWQVTQSLRASVRGGPQFYSLSSTAASANSGLNTSYYAALNVNHKLTHYISQQLNLQRDVSLGLNSASDYVEQFTANYSVSWALTQRITVGGDITYQHGSQPLLVTVQNVQVFQTEDFDRYGFGVNFSWSITDHLTATVHYSYWDRQSNLPDQGYTRNNVGLQVNYGF